MSDWQRERSGGNGGQDGGILLRKTLTILSLLSISSRRSSREPAWLPLFERAVCLRDHYVDVVSSLSKVAQIEAWTGHTSHRCTRCYG